VLGSPGYIGEVNLAECVNHELYFCYPHMPIGKVWIYWLLFVFSVFVTLYGYGFLSRG